MDSDVGDIFSEAGSVLRDRAVGEDDERFEDDTWMTNPDEVEIQARSSEIAANAIEKLAARSAEKHVEEHFTPFPRIKGYRNLAARMRERGSVDVRWPDSM